MFHRFLPFDLLLLLFFSNCMYCDKFVSIDWSRTNEIVSENTVDVDPLPAQVENFGNCHCDLTFEICDVGCCCDLDCTQQLRQTFKICSVAQQQFQTLRTGNISNPLFQYLNRFLEINSEINPYLGEYYSHRPIVRNILNYNGILAERSTNEQYISYNRGSDRSSSYKYGTNLEVLTNNGDFEFLSVGQITGSASDCSFLAPVQFAVSRSSQCFRTISIENCSGGTSLDAKVYTTGNDYFGVLATPGENGTVVSMHKQYFCKSKGPADKTESSSNQILLILTNDSAISVDDTTECSSLSPTFDQQANVCRNVVISLLYNFVWNGPEIKDIRITIALADVPRDATFAQKFDIKWSHKTFIVNDTNLPNHRFYQIGASYVLCTTSFSVIHDNSSFLSRPTATNQIETLKVFKPGPDSLCSSNRNVDVTFGVNAESTCYLSLNRENFRNCTSLKQMFLNEFNQIIKFEYLVRNLRSGMESLIDILRLNESDDSPSIDQTGERSSWQTFCRLTPTMLNLLIQYSEVSNVNGTALYEIVGALLQYTKTTIVFKSSTERSQFPLTARILFTKVPSKVTPIIKFFKTHESSSCLNAPSLSVCWDELFYAFTTKDIDRDEQIYRLIVGLSTVFVLVTSFFVTRLWF